ncbi:hypothetical protein LP419_07635 [Massilia sp. H-1]|nr:hypothetical protein LP419_07635 [Massilia sp. H-1]
MSNEPRPVAGSGGPPYDDDMDRRLTILETRFDTILPTLATKHDLELLRVEIYRGFDNLRDSLRSEFRGSMRSYVP